MDGVLPASQQPTSNCLQMAGARPKCRSGESQARGRESERLLVANGVRCPRAQSGRAAASSSEHPDVSAPRIVSSERAYETTGPTVDPRSREAVL